MASAPSSIALYADFAGASGSPFPSGWQSGLYSGEDGWQLDGSGNLVPSAAGWRSAAASGGGFIRGADPGGVVAEFSVIPSAGMICSLFLLNDRTADSADGYLLRWDKGTDFQLQRLVTSAGTYLDGVNESTISGTITTGFLAAVMIDNAGVTAYVSTNGGGTWQQVGTSTHTTHTGTFYAGIEANATSGVPKLTNVWAGLNGSGASDLETFIMSKSPFLYWKMDEADSTAAVDSSGNSNNATSVTGSPTSVAGSIDGSGTAISFGAASTRMNVSGAPSGAPANAFTFAATMKLGGSASSWTNLFGSASGWATTAGSFLFFESATQLIFGVMSTTPGQINAGWSNITKMRDGLWHRVVGTCDGTNVKLYVDGDLVASSSGLGTPTLNWAAGLQLGWMSGAGSASSVWDDFAIFSGAWVQTDVDDDYVAFAGPPPITYPTLTAGSAIVANTDSAAPYTLAVAMPAGHQAGDILFVLAMKDNAANLTTSTAGWAAVTGTQQNAVFSTCLFWKRATSSAEANMVLESSTSGLTVGIAAFPFFVRGCISTGDPWEDLTMNGSPTSSTTPASSAIDTTGPGRLALAIAAIGDNNAISNYPPSLWSAGANFNSATGNDYTALIIQREVPAAASIAAVNIATQAASDYWRTFTFALKPEPALTNRLKRWSGSSWVLANMKAYSGGSWVAKPFKKT